MNVKHLVLGLVTSLAAGCGSSEFDLVPVSGVVTLDGEPLADAVVNFQPIAPADATTGGPGSNSRTDAEGNFDLSTVLDDEPGAVVGIHKVSIFSYSPESPIASDTDAGPSKERVPEQYNYKSKLTFDVPSGGTDKAVFELTTASE